MDNGQELEFTHCVIAVGSLGPVPARTEQVEMVWDLNFLFVKIKFIVCIDFLKKASARKFLRGLATLGGLLRGSQQSISLKILRKIQIMKKKILVLRSIRHLTYNDDFLKCYFDRNWLLKVCFREKGS